MTMNKILHRVISILLYGIISSAAAFLISLIISNIYNTNPLNIMGYIGIFIMFIAALSLGRGSPNINVTVSIGQSNSQYSTYASFENARIERSITNYYQNAKNHAQFYFTSSRLNVLFNGLIVFLTSYFLSRFFC